ncbi:MAG: DUF58 domain-containing protein [Proteobacteria bacterium]|nr:DUF58 domain-containing protein [Pseudomonadota bacterium]
MATLHDLRYDFLLDPPRKKLSHVLRLGSRGYSRPSYHPLLEITKPFEPGEPKKAIDWRMYARTDNLIVKKIKEPRAIPYEIICDLSESMYWPDPITKASHKIKSPQKSHLALRIAFNMAYNLLRLSEPVKLSLLSPKQVITPPTYSSPHKNEKAPKEYYYACYPFVSKHTLEECLPYLFLQEHGSTDGSLPPISEITETLAKSSGSHHQHNRNSDMTITALDNLTHVINSDHNSRVIFISDLISEFSLNVTQNLKDLTCIHLLSELEKNINWLKKSSLYGEHSNHHNQQKTYYSSRSIEKNYHLALTKWLQTINSSMKADYCLMWCDDSLDSYQQKMKELLWE